MGSLKRALHVLVLKITTMCLFGRKAYYQCLIMIYSGTGVKLMKSGPRHIMDAEDFEPLYVP